MDGILAVLGGRRAVSGVVRKGFLVCLLFLLSTAAFAQVQSTLWKTDKYGTPYMIALIHVPEVNEDVKYTCYTSTDNPLASLHWSWRDNNDQLSPTVKSFMEDFGIVVMLFSYEGLYCCNYRDKNGKYWFGVYVEED